MGLFSSDKEVIIDKKKLDVEKAEEILKEKYDLSDIDPRDLAEVKSMLKQAAELGLDDANNIPKSLGNTLFVNFLMMVILTEVKGIPHHSFDLDFSNN